MLLKSCANFLLLIFVPFVIGVKEREKSGIRENKRYAPEKINNFAQFEGSLSGQKPQKPHHAYQQIKHSNFLQKPYVGNVNEVGGEDSQKKPVMETESKYVEKSSKQTTPALSAIALLGFLYYLNLIQGTNGRKKRSAESSSGDAEEGVQDYLTSIEGIISQISDILPQDDTEEGKAEGRALNKLTREPSSRGTVQERAFRIVDFIGSLFAKIPQALGLSDQGISRNDYVTESSSQSSGPNFWSFFGRRVGLVARIMDFLDDPNPSRVGRSVLEVERNEIDPNEDYAEPSELSAEERAFLPFDSKEEHSRKKRFTNEEMNIWYSEGLNHGEEESSYAFGDNGKIVGMVFNLFKNALTS